MGSVGKKNNSTMAENNFAEIDEIAERRNYWQKENDAIYTINGTIYYDRRTGEKVPMDYVKKADAEIRKANAEYEKAVEKLSVNETANSYSASASKKEQRFSQNIKLGDFVSNSILDHQKAEFEVFNPTIKNGKMELGQKTVKGYAVLDGIYKNIGYSMGFYENNGTVEIVDIVTGQRIGSVTKSPDFDTTLLNVKAAIVRYGRNKAKG